MIKKYTTNNIHPKVLDDKGEVNQGNMMLEVLSRNNNLEILNKCLDTASLLHFYLSTKVFRVRHWKKQFRKAIYQRLMNCLPINLVSSVIDQKCTQFIYWDMLLDFKRINHKFGNIYKYLSVQTSLEYNNIQKDIERTFQNHLFYQQQHNRQKLLRVLTAFSKHMPSIGYVQGFNQIAGVFLLNGLSEQQTFWILCYIMKKIKTLYTNSFEELNFLNYSVAVFLRNLIPNLSQKLLDKGVDISFITTRWFLTLFSYDFPAQFVNIILTQLITVWNLFILKGIKILVRFSLAVFQMITELGEIEDIYQYLKDNLLDILDDYELQERVLYHFQTMKVTNKLMGELRQKFQNSDDSFTLSFDPLTQKYYWKMGGSSLSARSLVYSFNDMGSEIHDEQDSSYAKSQSFLNALFPRIINYSVASEGMKHLQIKTEKRPQLILRHKVTPKSQFKMSLPKSANGDQESNINADEMQSQVLSQILEDNSIEIECQPKPFRNFIVPLVKFK